MNPDPTEDIRQWILNDPGLYDVVAEMRLNAAGDAEGGHWTWTPQEHYRFALADALKDYFEENIPESIEGVYLELLTTALAHVDWQELADALQSDE